MWGVWFFSPLSVSNHITDYLKWGKIRQAVVISISIMCVRISKKTPCALLTLMKTPVASALVYRFSSPDSCSPGEGVTTLTGSVIRSLCQWHRCARPGSSSCALCLVFVSVYFVNLPELASGLRPGWRFCFLATGAQQWLKGITQATSLWFVLSCAAQVSSSARLGPVDILDKHQQEQKTRPLTLVSLPVTWCSIKTAVCIWSS